MQVAYITRKVFADGSDPHIRLEAYMAEERGGKDSWRVEYCYLM